MCDQPGFRVTNDNEIEGQKPGGSNGDAPSISRSCDKRHERNFEDIGRSAGDARGPEIPATRQVRNAGVARDAAGF